MLLVAVGAERALVLVRAPLHLGRARGVRGQAAPEAALASSRYSLVRAAEERPVRAVFGCCQRGTHGGDDWGGGVAGLDIHDSVCAGGALRRAGLANGVLAGCQAGHVGRQEVLVVRVAGDERPEVGDALIAQRMHEWVYEGGVVEAVVADAAGVGAEFGLSNLGRRDVCVEADQRGDPALALRRA